MSVFLKQRLIYVVDLRHFRTPFPFRTHLRRPVQLSSSCLLESGSRLWMKPRCSFNLFSYNFETSPAAICLNSNGAHKKYLSMRYARPSLTKIIEKISEIEFLVINLMQVKQLFGLEKEFRTFKFSYPFPCLQCNYLFSTSFFNQVTKQLSTYWKH